MAGLKFRVLLDSKSKEEVFRDLHISAEDNFESFYKAILSAYNFSGDQMASFYMSNDNWDKGHEISLFDMSFGEDPDQIQPGVMKSSILGDLIQDEDQKIILVHDFLKMWIFLIELQDTTEETPAIPKTVLAIGDAPTEDSKTEDEDLKFETESEMEGDEEDEFGFGEFEEGGYDY
jgi:hypothetical protein